VDSVIFNDVVLFKDFTKIKNKHIQKKIQFQVRKEKGIEIQFDYEIKKIIS